MRTLLVFALLLLLWVASAQVVTEKLTAYNSKSDSLIPLPPLPPKLAFRWFALKFNASGMSVSPPDQDEFAEMQFQLSHATAKMTAVENVAETLDTQRTESKRLFADSGKQLNKLYTRYLRMFKLHKKFPRKRRLVTFMSRIASEMAAVQAQAWGRAHAFVQDDYTNFADLVSLERVRMLMQKEIAKLSVLQTGINY